MNQVLQFVEQNQVLILIGMALLLVLLFIISLSLSIRIGKWKKKYYKMMGGKDYQSLEEMLLKHNQQMGKMLEEVEVILEKQRKLDRQLETCVQKVGIIRYNAFNDFGSDLSYSIALLDNNNDGIVLSSIHGRDFCNTYAKPIVRGESTYKLTAEEILAMDRAKKTTYA